MRSLTLCLPRRVHGQATGKEEVRGVYSRLGGEKKEKERKKDVVHGIDFTGIIEVNSRSERQKYRQRGIYSNILH